MRLACVSALAAAAAAVLAGCGDTTAIRGGGKVGGDTVAVYAVVPLTGPLAAEGRDVVSGAKLALAQAGSRAGGFDVAFSALDEAGEGPGPSTRRALEDLQIIAAIGAYTERAARVAVPLFNEAGILLVSPAAGSGRYTSDPGLQPSGRLSFDRLGPDYEFTFLGRDPGRAALALRARPPAGQVVLPHPIPGLAGRLPTSLQQRVDVLQSTLTPGPFADAFRERFGRPATAQAKLGHTAMRAILAAIDRAGSRGNVRPAVLDAYFAGQPVDDPAVRWRALPIAAASAPAA